MELEVEIHLEQKIKDSGFKGRNRDEDRPATGAPSKGNRKEKAINMPKTTPRGEIAYVRPRKANVQMESRTRSRMNQTRKAKERDDLVHLHRHVRRTEVRKVMEKVVMTEVQKGKPKLTGKVCQEDQTDHPVYTSRKQVVRMEGVVILRMFLHVQSSKTPAGCKFGDSCIENTQLNLRMNRKTQQLVQFTFRRMMNA